VGEVSGCHGRDLGQDESESKVWNEVLIMGRIQATKRASCQHYYLRETICYEVKHGGKIDSAMFHRRIS